MMIFCMVSHQRIPSRATTHGAKINCNSKVAKGTYILVYAQIKCKPYNEKWRIHTQHFENSNTLEQTIITHLYFRFKYGAPYGMD